MWCRRFCLSPPSPTPCAVLCSISHSVATLTCIDGCGKVDALHSVAISSSLFCGPAHAHALLLLIYHPLLALSSILTYTFLCLRLLARSLASPVSHCVIGQFPLALPFSSFCSSVSRVYLLSFQNEPRSERSQRIAANSVIRVHSTLFDGVPR